MSDDDWYIESLSSSPIKPTCKPQRMNFNQYDRPDISMLNKPRDLPLQSDHLKIPSSVITKREFIQQWLQTHPDVHNGSQSSSSSSSVIQNSSPTKRPSVSPLTDLNQVKRLKNSGEKIKTVNNIIMKQNISVSRQAKENKIQREENNNQPVIEKENLHLISDTLSSESASEAKLAYKAAIFNSYKRNRRESIIPITDKSVKSALWPKSCNTTASDWPQVDINNVEDESSQIIDIQSSASSILLFESSPSIHFESSLTTRSSAIAIEQIESELSDENRENIINFEDIDNDVTISQIIEDVDPPLIEAVLSQKNADDSDETNYSPAGPLNKTMIPDELSQQISHNSGKSSDELVMKVNSTDRISLNISSGTSLPSKRSELEIYQTNLTTKTINKKKKKPKKYVFSCDKFELILINLFCVQRIAGRTTTKSYHFKDIILTYMETSTGSITLKD